MIEPEGFGEHGPFDVILELVGAPNIPDNLGALNLWGRIVVIGIGAGAKAEINLGLLMGKRGTDPRFDAAPAPARGEGACRPRGGALGAAAASPTGAVTVPIAATYPLDEAEAAYERFTAGGKLGKIVLVTDVVATAANAEPAWYLRAQHVRSG